MDRVKTISTFFIIIALICTMFFPTKSAATSWAFEFVVYDGYVYVVGEETVEDVEEEIGNVTQYSDMASLAGNFSNHYPVGTKYYSIKGVSAEEAIAVEESEGNYLRAERETKYQATIQVDDMDDAVDMEEKPRKSVDLSMIIIFTVLGLLAVTAISLIVWKGMKK
ncbi:hypothetical protein JOC95_001596 [Bacillus tianshenii]|uniref:Uncharacterized protein n=1 Tax=Sutcliffiella tianshenii TaxID=1463404 RepID=A0ABS2NYP7_9BACI|nr:hypothetical protein [Bacillus tianshenii]MBM7619744.1 hypothetical protein [Bacillus tianshenii]